MMNFLKFRILLLFTILCAAAPQADACTSMLVSAKASGTGRPLMWKNRDTGNEHNFVAKVPATDKRRGYVALFNGGDSILSQAWMGMNDAGFAIMNTASYNLAPDTAKLKDQEGYLMNIALSVCATVSDFERLLRNLHSLNKPIGVQANFGVMDANGALAYFEVSDHQFKRFNVADSPEGFLIRTNYSESGEKGGGYGYIRELNLRAVLSDEIARKAIRPESLTEKASKSFYNAVLNKDFAADSCTWVVDQDFIPRETSTASIVIEGVLPGQSVDDMLMWTVLGYPPCSFMVPVSLSSVPADFQPTAEGFRSPFNNNVLKLKETVFPIKYGNGNRYINMTTLRPMMQQMRLKSIDMYRKVYELRNNK